MVFVREDNAISMRSNIGLATSVIVDNIIATKSVPLSLIFEHDLRRDNIDHSAANGDLIIQVTLLHFQYLMARVNIVTAERRILCTSCWPFGSICNTSIGNSMSSSIKLNIFTYEGDKQVIVPLDSYSKRKVKLD